MATVFNPGSADALPVWHIDITGTGSGPITLANATTGETATLSVSTSTILSGGGAPDPPSVVVPAPDDPFSPMPAGGYLIGWAFLDSGGGYGPASSTSSASIGVHKDILVYGPASPPTGATAVTIFASFGGGNFQVVASPSLAGYGPLNGLLMNPPNLWGALFIPGGGDTYTSGDALELNRDGYTVTLNGVDAFNLFDGEIPRLIPGANDITLTAGGTATVGALQIIYAPRYQ